MGRPSGKQQGASEIRHKPVGLHVPLLGMSLIRTTGRLEGRHSRLELVCQVIKPVGNRLTSAYFGRGSCHLNGFALGGWKAPVSLLAIGAMRLRRFSGDGTEKCLSKLIRLCLSLFERLIIKRHENSCLKFQCSAAANVWTRRSTISVGSWPIQVSLILMFKWPFEGGRNFSPKD